MRFISSQLLNEKLAINEIVVLDIRESYERDICSIHSLHIPMGEIESRIFEIPKDLNIVLLCKSGRRAEVVANLLEKENDFTNLFVLEGGIISWIENIDPSLEIY